jgi:hypothetical protein
MDFPSRHSRTVGNDNVERRCHRHPSQFSARYLFALVNNGSFAVGSLLSCSDSCHLSEKNDSTRKIEYVVSIIELYRSNNNMRQFGPDPQDEPPQESFTIYLNNVVVCALFIGNGPMKITFPPLFAIVGVLAHFQFIAIGQELEPSPTTSGALLPKDAPAPARGALLQGQGRNGSISAERVALDEVRDAVQADPNKAPDIVRQAIKTDVPHPVALTCEIVRVAIAAIGKKATRVLVARIVYSAANERPGEVLGIVGVAIQDTPSSFHRDIVHAAIAAVPDPYVRVSRASLESEPCNRPATWNGPTAAQSDGKNIADFGKEVEPKETVYPPTQPESYEWITLSDAIYEEALLTGATAYELDYFPVLGVTGIANDYPINKSPPPTPPPVSP